MGSPTAIYVSRIRSDDQVIGRRQANYMAQVLHGKGNIVVLRGPTGTSWAQIRGDSFRERFSEISPGIKIVGEQYSQSTPQDGLRLMKDFLETYPQITRSDCALSHHQNCLKRWTAFPFR